jgi:hypothetical protein
MRSFVELASLPQQQRVVVDHLLRAEYTSSLNEAFKHVLGPYRGTNYSRFRAQKVGAFARSWAARNGVQDDALFDGQAARPRTAQFGTTRAQVDSTVKLPGRPLRDLLSDLLDTFSDEELERIQLPVAAVARMIESRHRHQA